MEILNNNKENNYKDYEDTKKLNNMNNNIDRKDIKLKEGEIRNNLIDSIVKQDIVKKIFYIVDEGVKNPEFVIDEIQSQIFASLNSDEIKYLKDNLQNIVENNIKDVSEVRKNKFLNIFNKYKDEIFKIKELKDIYNYEDEDTKVQTIVKSASNEIFDLIKFATPDVEKINFDKIFNDVQSKINDLGINTAGVFSSLERKSDTGRFFDVLDEIYDSVKEKIVESNNKSELKPYEAKALNILRTYINSKKNELRY